jgi:hypothetical protein
MLTSFASCAQKFNLAFRQGYRPKGVSIDLHAGACFATAVETVRRQVHVAKQSLANALVVAHARFMQEWGEVEPPEWNARKKAKSKDNVWYGVESYFERWSPLTDYVKPYRTTEGQPTLEYTFSLPLEPLTRLQSEGGFPSHPSDPDLPFVYAGKFDMLGELHNRPVVCDDKTTSGIGPTWADQWDLRRQFIGYVWALQQLGFDCDTAVIRGVSFQVTEVKLIEAIRPYSKFLVDRWHEQLRRDLWRIVACYEADYWDYNLADACTAYGGCQFAQVCGSPHGESWLSEFEVRHWSPLSHHPDPESLINPPLVR